MKCLRFLASDLLAINSSEILEDVICHHWFLNAFLCGNTLKMKKIKAIITRCILVLKEYTFHYFIS